MVFFLGVIVALLGIWIGRIEGWKRWDAVCFAFITATTVGYGDMRPTKPLARLLAILAAFVGLIMTGIIVAA